METVENLVAGVVSCACHNVGRVDEGQSPDFVEVFRCRVDQLVARGDEITVVSVLEFLVSDLTRRVVLVLGGLLLYVANSSCFFDPE